MIPSAQLTLEQLKEITEDKKKTDQDSREVQKQVHGKEILNAEIPVQS
jgi:hypothetical protein